MSYKIQVAALLGALASSVQAHGHIGAIKVDGTAFTAYDPSFQYQTPPPEVIEWSCPECLDNGFVAPTSFNDVTKIACHKDATAGAKVATVKAGGSIDIQWNTWPSSHVGPVIDYLAKVDDATTTKSADLSFFKIDEAGFADGKWAAANLVANNLTWSLTIPSTIASGQYVLRHEIIALHSAGQADGAQAYPKCFNLEVTDGGSATPAGVTADKLYTPTDPGILVNIYSGDNTGYKIPGPALFSGASSGSSSGSAPAAASSAAPAAASSAAPAPASSAAPTPASSAAPAAASSAGAEAAATPTPSAVAPSTPSSTAGAGALDKEFTLTTFIAWLQEKADGTIARRHSRAFRN